MLIWGCASQKTQVIALQQHIEGMRADSLLLEKRIEKLKEENAYLSDNCASIEQAYNNRLKEKEDSLGFRKREIENREAQIADMRARSEEEREAFQKLSRAVFTNFQLLNLGPDKMSAYNGCSYFVIEIADKLMFQQGTTKPEPSLNVVCKQVSEVLSKHPDLSLQVISMTDSVTSIKDKHDDIWVWNTTRAQVINKTLQKDFGIATQKIIVGAQVPKIGFTQQQLQSNNKIRFVFQSALLPCVH